jgi:DNA-binding NarL/FixJ family response regulator
MDTRGLKVLIIDNEPSMREALKLFLETWDDFELVGAAATAMEGLALCAELEPDVILTQLTFPDMDGIELIRRARQQCPDTPIVVLTGTFSIDKMREAFEAGATQFLEKWTPVDRIADSLRGAGHQGIPSRKQ